MRKKGIVLKYDSKTSFFGGNKNMTAVIKDLIINLNSTIIYTQKSRDTVKSSTFTAAGRPKECNELTSVDRQVKIFKHM